MFDTLSASGHITEDEALVALARISTSDDLSLAVAGADFVSEAIIEDLEIKRHVIRDVCNFTRRDTVVSTNTMSLSVSDISMGCNSPERVIGVRFLYPVLLITDVEMTVGAETSNSTVEQVKSMLIQDGYG